MSIQKYLSIHILLDKNKYFKNDPNKPTLSFDILVMSVSVSIVN